MVCNNLDDEHLIYAFQVVCNVVEGFILRFFPDGLYYCGTMNSGSIGFLCVCASLQLFVSLV